MLTQAYVHVVAMKAYYGWVLRVHVFYYFHHTVRYRILRRIPFSVLLNEVSSCIGSVFQHAKLNAPYTENWDETWIEATFYFKPNFGSSMEFHKQLKDSFKDLSSFGIDIDTTL